jgi:hypothetical protein
MVGLRRCLDSIVTLISLVWSWGGPPALYGYTLSLALSATRGVVMATHGTVTVAVGAKDVIVHSYNHMAEVRLSFPSSLPSSLLPSLVLTAQKSVVMATRGFVNLAMGTMQEVRRCPPSLPPSLSPSLLPSLVLLKVGHGSH